MLICTMHLQESRVVIMATPLQPTAMAQYDGTDGGQQQQKLIRKEGGECFTLIERLQMHTKDHHMAAGWPMLSNTSRSLGTIQTHQY